MNDELMKLIKKPSGVEPGSREYLCCYREGALVLSAVSQQKSSRNYKERLRAGTQRHLPLRVRTTFRSHLFSLNQTCREKREFEGMAEEWKSKAPHQ
jgi:hypothetical protein